MSRIFRFKLKLIGIINGFVGPVYDDDRTLIGGFTKDPESDSLISGFISGTEYPLALRVSTGDGFYVTPVYTDLTIDRLIISEFKISIESIKIQAEES